MGSLGRRFAVLLLVVVSAVGQQAGKLTFQGRAVTVTDPGTDAEGQFPKGPASVCVEGPPRRQCYTAPKEFGRFPSAKPVTLGKDRAAILFSAASGGVSGFQIRLALLQPGDDKDLAGLFNTDILLSNQSQSLFWTEPSISEFPIFVTADFVWGPEDSHYGTHRFTISAYTLRSTEMIDEPHYYLEDRFMTAKSYDLQAQGNPLMSEKAEIIERLKRAKAAQ